MKKYPRINWKTLSLPKQKEFDRIEEIVKDYLDMDNGNYWNDILSYNLAFLISTDNLDKIIK